MLYRMIIAVVFVITASSAYTQTRVGTSVIDGEVVDLYSDQSWKYRSGTDADCDQITIFLEFCDVQELWKSTTKANDDISAMYRHNDRIYGMFIVEELGTNDGLTADFMRKAVVTNLANAAGTSESEIIVYGVTQDSIQDQFHETITYGGTVDGLNVIYINTIVTSPKTTVQVATFSIGSQLSQDQKAMHKSFLDGTKITLPK